MFYIFMYKSQTKGVPNKGPPATASWLREFLKLVKELSIQKNFIVLRGAPFPQGMEEQEGFRDEVFVNPLYQRVLNDL